MREAEGVSFEVNATGMLEITAVTQFSICFLSQPWTPWTKHPFLMINTWYRSSLVHAYRAKIPYSSASATVCIFFFHVYFKKLLVRDVNKCKQCCSLLFSNELLIPLMNYWMKHDNIVLQHNIVLIQSQHAGSFIKKRFKKS